MRGSDAQAALAVSRNNGTERSNKELTNSNIMIKYVLYVLF